MVFANGDIYRGMWKYDQMCDKNGEYSFANGNNYMGCCKQCSKLTNNKYGQFDGEGTLSLFGLGIYKGSFQNNKICGKGKFTSLDQTFELENNWPSITINQFITKVRAFSD